MSAALFKKKELEPCKRVCFRLQQLREERMISLSQLATKTNISRQHIEAIESCNFKKLPEGAVYHRNFVRRYLEALDVDPAPYLKQFHDEEAEALIPRQTQERTVPYYFQFANIPAAIRLCGIFVLLLLITGYLGLQVRRIIKPPELTLLSPQNGLVSTHDEVIVKGITEQEAVITINGEAIQNSEQGTFEQIVTLSPGLNTITIMAKKKHGKTTQETIFMVLREDAKEI